MRPTSGLVLTVVSVLTGVFGVLGACAGDKDPTDTTDATPPDTTETGTPPPTGDTGPAEVTELVVADGNVYTVTQSYTIASGTVRSGWDALISWPDLTTDAWGDPLSPAAVPVFGLLEVVETPQGLPARLAADDLGSDLVSVWRADVTGASFGVLTDLAAGKTPFDPVAYLTEDAAKTWVVFLADLDGDRLVPRTYLALQVDDAGDTAIVLSPGSTTVSWTASFDGAALPVTAGLPGVTLDWDGLVMDALGKPYDDRLGDELFIGRFSGDAASLGASMMAPEAAAEVWYTMDVAQDTDARLELARDAGGGTFPGFDRDGTWLVGVRCRTCLSRLPLWVAVVDVR